MAISSSNAFGVLDLLEENQLLFEDGFSIDPNDDVATINVVKDSPSCDEERPGFKSEVDDVLNVSSLDDDEWPGFNDDGDKIDEWPGSDDRDHDDADVERDSSSDDDDEGSRSGDSDHVNDNEVDERPGFAYDYAHEGELKPLINQPDNLLIDEDELDGVSNEYGYQPWDRWSSDWSYCSDWYTLSDQEIDIEYNDLYLSYNARKEPGKQRLKRMSGKKTGTAKLMKLKRSLKCCNCQRLV